jgi:hypothetical protein
VIDEPSDFAGLLKKNEGVTQTTSLSANGR